VRVSGSVGVANLKAVTSQLHMLMVFLTQIQLPNSLYVIFLALGYNCVSGAAKLKAMYDAMRPHYFWAATHSFYFDAELVETVINKMKLGKAAGLDGLL